MCHKPNTRKVFPPCEFVDAISDWHCMQKTCHICHTTTFFSSCLKYKGKQKYHYYKSIITAMMPLKPFILYFIQYPCKCFNFFFAISSSLLLSKNFKFIMGNKIYFQIHNHCIICMCWFHVIICQQLVTYRTKLLKKVCKTLCITFSNKTTCICCENITFCGVLIFTVQLVEKL